MRIERTKLGSESWIECPDSAGRVEMMSDRLEFELSTAVCLPQSPPVPTAFKLIIVVVAYDHSNRNFYVRWRATQYSFGYYSSSNGFARMGFR